MLLLKHYCQALLACCQGRDGFYFQRKLQNRLRTGLGGAQSFLCALREQNGSWCWLSERAVQAGCGSVRRVQLQFNPSCSLGVEYSRCLLWRCSRRRTWVCPVTGWTRWSRRSFPTPMTYMDNVQRNFWEMKSAFCTGSATESPQPHTSEEDQMSSVDLIFNIFSESAVQVAAPL